MNAIQAYCPFRKLPHSGSGFSSQMLLKCANFRQTCVTSCFKKIWEKSKQYSLSRKNRNSPCKHPIPWYLIAFYWIYYFKMELVTQKLNSQYAWGFVTVFLLLFIALFVIGLYSGCLEMALQSIRNPLLKDRYKSTKKLGDIRYETVLLYTVL